VSIGKIQEKILTQKGCGTAIGIGVAFVMSFFIFGQCSPRYSGMDQGQSGQASNASVAAVGDVDVKATDISDRVAQSSQGQPQVSFASTAQQTSSALSELLNNAAYEYIAKRDHIALTDAALMSAASGVVDEQMEMQKMQLQMQSKPGTPPKDFEAEFKKRTGKTTAQAKKEALDKVKTIIAKPDTRQKLLDNLIAPVVQEALVSAAKPSDAEIRASYDTYVLKRILITKNSITDPKGEKAKAKADEALKAVQGGMSFESAMEKYSGEPPQPGKKLTDSVISLPASAMSMQPTYKPLVGQKVGFISPVEEGPEGLSIYKVTAIKNDAPKDFDAKRDEYKKRFVQSQVQSKLQDEVKSVLDSKALTWTNKGYEALYDYSKIQMSNPPDKNAALKKIEDEAQAAMKDPPAKEPALYAWFQAETDLYNGPDRSKLVQGRIDLLSAVLETTEDYDLRLELADLYTQQKKGKEALQDLIQASQANTLYDENGQKRFGDLAAKADTLVKNKLVSEADLKLFRDAQDAWKKSKADDDASQAQMAAQEAKQRQQDAANEKANEEAMKKQKAAAATPKAPGGKPADVKTTTPPVKVNPAPTSAKPSSPPPAKPDGKP
jgi:hypothetical protein